MGTRNLTIVQYKGDYKVAQYGQWDGYPSGQGAVVLNFLKGWDRPSFEEKVAAATFMDEDDYVKLNAIIQEEKLQDTWPKRWPELSRDPAAEILEIIASNPAGIKLKNSISFAGDSLFCEWSYVIDLDTNKLEVFKGFNETPLNEGERFLTLPNLDKTEGYYPVRIVASYDLDALPTVEEMEKTCDPQEIPDEDAE